jgi:hypothetical protein
MSTIPEDSTQIEKLLVDEQQDSVPPPPPAPISHEKIDLAQLEKISIEEHRHTKPDFKKYDTLMNSLMKTIPIKQIFLFFIVFFTFKLNVVETIFQSYFPMIFTPLTSPFILSILATVMYFGLSMYAFT